MKMILKAFGLLLVAALLAAVVIFFWFPGTLVSATQKFAASSAGLQKKTVNIDGYTLHYYEGGQGSPLVLLHGMGDEKNSFVKSAAALTDKHRVILPDLQGHGENAPDSTRDYSIHGHVLFLQQFFKQIGLAQFHLGGNSMGGHVSAAYALAYPTQVKKLILINAAGLQLDEHVVYAGFPQALATEKDFHAVMDRVFYKRPSLPGPLLQHMMAQINQSRPLLNAMATQVKAGKDFDLKDRIAQIKAPTLIVWGSADQVVRHNVAQAYDERIAQSDLVQIKEAGHSPQLEKPAEVAAAIRQFLARP
jgi:abhydrolase domain-containing protein 6